MHTVLSAGLPHPNDGLKKQLRFLVDVSGSMYRLGEASATGMIKADTRALTTKKVQRDGRSTASDAGGYCHADGGTLRKLSTSRPPVFSVISAALFCDRYPTHPVAERFRTHVRLLHHWTQWRQRQNSFCAGWSVHVHACMPAIVLTR